MLNFELERRKNAWICYSKRFAENDRTDGAEAVLPWIDES
jgi:hypothetical protein